MTSLEQIKQKYDGIYPGFHFLRHILAFIILFHHSRILLRGIDVVTGDYVKGNILSTVGGDFSLADFSVELLRPFLFALVGGFFALSGFLVADSAIRTKDIKVFLTFRILRIFPALMSEVTLSALLLGVAFTTLPLSEYFSSPMLYHYFGNILGDVHYFLPGVFVNNPISGMVNGNLWTLPSEFHCYLIMAGLMLTRVLFNQRMFLVVFIILSIAALLLPFFTDWVTRSDNTHFSGWFIVYLFFAGVFCSLFSSRIPMNIWIFTALGILYVFTMLFSVSDFFSGLCLVYCTLYLGTLKYEWFDKLVKADYSYGSYLYGYPIAQSVVYVLMGIGITTMPKALALPLVFGITFALTILFASVSWRFIEKPCLNLKKYFLKKP